MKTVSITPAEFREFCELQRKHSWLWPARFSTNPRGDVWPYWTKGPTPTNQRENVRHYSELLAQVADICRERRDEEGGRFFINENGAFWKSVRGQKPIQFVAWDSGGETLERPDSSSDGTGKAVPRPITIEELRRLSFRPIQDLNAPDGK